MSAYAVRCSVGRPRLCPGGCARCPPCSARCCGPAVGMGEAHAGEEEPRHCLAARVDGDPVDEIAVEEGGLLRGALAATVDAADLLCASCHPEEHAAPWYGRWFHRSDQRPAGPCRTGNPGEPPRDRPGPLPFRGRRRRQRGAWTWRWHGRSCWALTSTVLVPAGPSR